MTKQIFSPIEMKVDHRCVCEVCTCHKHHCKVHHKRTGPPLETTTEYSASYIKKDGCRPKDFKNPVVFPPHRKFDGVTSYMEEFVERPLEKRTNKTMNHYVPNKNKFCGESTSRVDYPDWKAKPDARVHPDYNVLQNKPFQGESIFTTDYKNWGIGALNRPPKKEYIPSNIKMNDISTTTHDYQPWEVKRRPPKEKQVFVSSKDDRDFKSTCANDYVEMKVPVCHAKPKNVYIPSKDKLETSTTNRDSFKAWEMDKTPHAKPPYSYIPSQDDRDFTSVNNSTYVPYNIQPREKPPQRPYIPNSCPFDGTTNNRVDYVKWPLQKKFVKENEVYIPRGKFEGDSTYNTTYVPKFVPKQSGKLKVFVPKPGKFNAETITQTDFRNPGKCERTKDFNPNYKYKNYPDTRDFMSECHAQHSYKPMKICEVIKRANMDIPLEDLPNGHQYFKLEVLGNNKEKSPVKPNEIKTALEAIA